MVQSLDSTPIPLEIQCSFAFVYLANTFIQSYTGSTQRIQNTIQAHGVKGADNGWNEFKYSRRGAV